MPDGTLDQLSYMFIGQIELNEQKDSRGKTNVPDIKALDKLIKDAGYYQEYYIVIQRQSKKPIAKVYGR